MSLGIYAIDELPPAPTTLLVLEDFSTFFTELEDNSIPVLSARETLTITTGDASYTWDMTGFGKAKEKWLSC